MTDQQVRHFRGLDFQPEGERIGQDFQLCYEPRMAGQIVGYNADHQMWLVELTVPYGANSGVYVSMPEAGLQADESLRKKGR